MNEIPHDNFCERAVLGACFISMEFLKTACIELNKSHFYRPAHSEIFGNLSELYYNYSSGDGPAPDIVMLLGILKSKNLLSFVGGGEYITSLLDGIPESIKIDSYIEVLKDRCDRRKLIFNLLERSKDLHDIKNELSVVIDETKSDIDNIKTESHYVPRRLSDALKKWDKNREDVRSGKKEIGIPCGIDALHSAIGPLLKGDLYYVCARPSHGKTAFMQNICINVAKQGYRALFVTMEMKELGICNRNIGIMSGCSINSIYQREYGIDDYDTDAMIDNARSELDKLDIFIDDRTSHTPTSIRSMLNSFSKTKNIDILFIDYLQIMGDDRKLKTPGTRELLKHNALGLQRIGKDYDIPILVGVQLRRGDDIKAGLKEFKKTDTEKAPYFSLQDLMEGGEQEADSVICLFNYGQEYPETTKPNELNFRITKGRNTGGVNISKDLTYYKECQQIK